MKKLITLLLVLTGCVMTASAVDYSLYLRCNLNATAENSWYSWNNDDSNYQFTFDGWNGSEDVFSYIIDASSWEGDIQFRLHRSNWGNTQQIPSKGATVEWSFSSKNQEVYEIWAASDDYKSDKYADKYFTIKHGDVGASKYKITVYWRASDNRIWMTVDLVSMPVSVSAAGYATFSCDRALNFSGKAIKAYYANATNSSTDKVSMTSITNPAANVGLFLQGTVGTAVSIDVPVIASGDASTPATNYLHPTTGNNIYNGSKVQYVFASQDGNLGFYPVAGDLSPAKGKAYLETNTALSRIGWAFDDDETTGIAGVENTAEETTQKVVYNLNGQRVINPGKGLYIVNGKKVIIK